VRLWWRLRAQLPRSAVPGYFCGILHSSHRGDVGASGSVRRLLDLGKAYGGVIAQAFMEGQRTMHVAGIGAAHCSLMCRARYLHCTAVHS
jgi:hypothetical protein